MIGYFTFIVSLILNFVLLCFVHNQGKNYYGYQTKFIIDIISYIMVVLVIIIVIFWLLTKYLLYYEIEKAKYKENHYDKNDLDDSQLAFYDTFVIKGQSIFAKGN
jgi:hypothetical protein